MVAPGQFGLEGFVGVGVQAGDAALARFQLRQQQRQLAIAGRAADQAHPRRALENALALLLRDAARERR